MNIILVSPDTEVFRTAIGRPATGYFAAVSQPTTTVMRLPVNIEP